MSEEEGEKGRGEGRTCQYPHARRSSKSFSSLLLLPFSFILHLLLPAKLSPLTERAFVCNGRKEGRRGDERKDSPTDPDVHVLCKRPSVVRFLPPGHLTQKFPCAAGCEMLLPFAPPRSGGYK